MAMLRRRDFWAGAMFVAFGVFFVFGARNYAMGSSARMGAGFFPTLLGWILIGLGLAIGGRAWFRPVELPRLMWRPLLVLAGAICLFAAILPTVGLVFSTIALVLVGSRADPESRLGESLVLSVVLSAFSTIVFHYGLGLPFRVWPGL